MRLEQYDPHSCTDHYLLIYCRHLDQIFHSYPAGADGILAYCYLDPLRGYRLFICSLVHINPLKLYRDYYVSLDLSFFRLKGEKGTFCMNEEIIPESIRQMVNEIKRVRTEKLMEHLHKKEIEGWTITPNAHKK